MIGTSVQPRRPCDHVDAADVGEAEVEHDDVGMMARRDLERDLAGASPRRPRSRGRCRFVIERAEELRFVVDDEDAAHRRRLLSAHDRGGAAFGRVLDDQLASHRRDEPARDREAEADTGAAVDRPAAGTAGRPAHDRCGLDAGPVIDDRAGRPGRARARPSTRTGRSGGDHRIAFSTRLATTRSRSAASAAHRGSVSGTSHHDAVRRARRGSRSRRGRPLRGAPAAASVAARRPAAGSCRAGSTPTRSGGRSRPRSSRGTRPRRAPTTRCRAGAGSMPTP